MSAGVKAGMKAGLNAGLKAGLSARGQVSLELMLLVMVMLLFLQTATLPVVQLSSKAAQDIGSVGKARLALDTIGRAIEDVGFSSGDSRRMVEVFVPGQTRLLCDAAARRLSFEVQLDSSLEKVSACAQDSDRDDFKCSFARPLPGAFGVECGRGPPWKGPGWVTVSVEKSGGGVIVE